MELRRAGRSGLQISSVGLGTLTWGRDTEEHDAAEQLEIFLEAGGNFIDTAATWGEGAAEEVLGKVIAERGVRNDVVIASKAGTRVHDDGGRVDSSRGTLLSALENSLRRLGTDYLDVWIVHHYDRDVALEETLGALDFAVRTGRARYVGLSNHPAWVAARAATLAEAQLPAPGLALLQAEYSLLRREAEADLWPAAGALGLGTVAWSGLGRGVLAGRYRTTIPPSSRAASPHLRGFVEPYLDDRSASIVEALHAAGEGLGCSAAQVALGWAQSSVTSVLIGASTPGQLRQTLAPAPPVPDEILTALDDVSATSSA